MKCRACGTATGHLVVNLGSHPFSNAFLAPDQLHAMEPHYPLEVYICPECWLMQLDEYEPAGNIFNADYAYFSSYSDSWLEHCRRYTDLMVDRFGYGPQSFVVEVASNDGYLLQYFKARGIPVLGVEPAANTAAVAAGKGIPTDVTFFDTAYAARLAAAGRRADLIIGNNVLAHNPHLNDFVEGMRVALKPGGTITMEFPHAVRLIQGNQFDTIYHEHFSYFTFHTVDRLFATHGLTLFDVEELPTHGGSLRIYGRHAAEQGRPVTDRAAGLLAREAAEGFQSLAVYRAFGRRVEATKHRLLEFLIDAKRAGKRIVGYGAPAKGNTLLNFCGIRTDFLDYTVDRNPHKQGRYLPGTRIPVKAPEMIMADRPDYVLILPWNIRAEIMEQMCGIHAWGGRFVIPIPEVEVC
ncbi:MAG: class I SAM-dependent methyltransferase [Planctomycetota bacterium]